MPLYLRLQPAKSRIVGICGLHSLQLLLLRIHVPLYGLPFLESVLSVLEQLLGGGGWVGGG
jgi:hypothetical protein